MAKYVVVYKRQEFDGDEPRLKTLSADSLEKAVEMAMVGDWEDFIIIEGAVVHINNYSRFIQEARERKREAR